MAELDYSQDLEHDSCGVGLITNKSSKQTHALFELADQALCKVPHRGGINAEGVGDGGGICFDLSVKFYAKLLGKKNLAKGEFGIANFFLPRNKKERKNALDLMEKLFAKYELNIFLTRDVPVDNSVLNEASALAQLPITQWVFGKPSSVSSWEDFEHLLNQLLLEIEEVAVNENPYPNFYPLSVSSRTQVYKGRLNAWEVVSYFKDLKNSDNEASMLFFHTRFSTNTAPNPLYAQPFRHLAHNGELNTDRKSRISELATASHHGYKLSFPPGQSDSARLDQTLTRRMIENRQPIHEIMVQMMPPAWENSSQYSQEMRDMLEYFSLSEEKNDGPAGLVFCDGIRIGASLDRLGLRPLRIVETEEYLVVSSEAGQIDFLPETIVSRGRIRAGGMIVFDHQNKTISRSQDILGRMAEEKPYAQLLAAARVPFNAVEKCTLEDVEEKSKLSYPSQFAAYGISQENLSFMLDPMLKSGAERVSAMGYGVAPNGLTSNEGGMTRYFTQRFAQVTNPPLDSIREVDGMTLRVALGAKPNFVSRDTMQLVLESPIVHPHELATIKKLGTEKKLSIKTVDATYPLPKSAAENGSVIEKQMKSVIDKVVALSRKNADIIILDDTAISEKKGALPAVLLIAAINQALIKEGLRFNSSIIYATGQISSTHDAALMLGFGASAIVPYSAYHRALELNSDDEVIKSLEYFRKAIHKSLLKTMGKFGLCTVESYIGGGFFETSFLNTEDPVLKRSFPGLRTPIGGVGFQDIAQSYYQWHQLALAIQADKDIPILGFFKERRDGAGHSFGLTSVQVFTEMTKEKITFSDEFSEDGERLHILPQDNSYLTKSTKKRTAAEIDAHQMTEAYKTFVAEMTAERKKKPATLRDVLALPANFNDASSKESFTEVLQNYRAEANINSACHGLKVIKEENNFVITLARSSEARYSMLKDALTEHFGKELKFLDLPDHGLLAAAEGTAARFLESISSAPNPININKVQSAHEITAAFASGAMSHGALVEKAHEAVAMGTNMVGAMSNSGEGGESSKRYNTLKASKIKQIASGRFGVWAGYLADPMLEELEIKLAQGAKPGEGGQLPAKKVTVEIAAARGGTPGVELISPPPHHDTYSIEDLAQLIHDCKAARVRVVVKLVSTEGIGTIAVGVAKAGADVINVAGNTGGTAAAQVTSLKHSGRIAELGLAEVHQALAANGLRDKVILRCSGAHQTGLDVIKSCLLGGDSFEFGTTALMMLKCVMAKNCNIKCPVGLTTTHEAFDGDPRALAQYFMNVAVEVREWLAKLGFTTLREMRGRSDLLHLIDHPALVGNYKMNTFLRYVEEVSVHNPVYLEKNFEIDDGIWESFEKDFASLDGDEFLVVDAGKLRNFNKSVAAQFSIDLEKYLNYQLDEEAINNHPKIIQLESGRKILDSGSVFISTENSAGQSFGAFLNSGIVLHHQGTCNDGVGKSMSGGRIVVENPGGGRPTTGNNVLLGNFALFGATGGEVFIQGEAGDRFGVRNSGAVAVVEGVGDFACEYMTNGSVINIGGFGKGFANGMSGGLAYQYDESGAIAQQASLDSVSVLSFNEDNDFVQAQEAILKWHLERHVECTESIKAQRILDQWGSARNYFYVLVPKAWQSQHIAPSVLVDHSRKEVIQRLSQSIASQLVRDANKQYQGKVLHDGKSPEGGNYKNYLSYDLIIAAGVLHRAMCVVKERQATNIEAAAKRLLANMDRDVIDLLVHDVQKALLNYEDSALAQLLAQQQLEDYQRALSMRESFDTPALGTFAWILYCQRRNHQLSAQFSSLSEVLAAEFSAAMAQTMFENSELVA